MTYSMVYAEPAQAPLELQNTFVEPNVMILLGSSSSMANSFTDVRPDGVRINKSRMVFAKEAVTNLINDYDGIRFCGSYLHSTSGIRIDNAMACSAEEGDKIKLIQAFNAISPEGENPLAESYFDLTRYFRHQQPYFGSFESAMADPITSPCQTNTIIVITDGPPTSDWDSNRMGGAIQSPIEPALEAQFNQSLPNWDGIHNDDGGKFLDDIALFGKQIDLKTGGVYDTPPFEQQKLKTHAISFLSSGDLLADTAAYGGGNYYHASNPEGLADALQDAMNNTVVAGTGTGTGASGSSLKNGNDVDFYVTDYNADTWWGELQSFALTETKQSGGSTVLGSTENWKASEQLPSHSARKLFSRKYDGIIQKDVALDFTSDNIDALSVEQQDYLGASRGSSGAINNRGEIQDLINYLRGDSTKARINEADESQPFRYRVSLLGDIVHARPVYVQNGAFGIPDDLSVAVNKRYSAYKTVQENREAMVYTGANDGIFHAFSADTGVEKFGFIPDTIFSKLAQYSDPNYNVPGNHRYYLDGQPTATDVKLAGDWQTIISVPFGAGGKGLFALNITNPTPVNKDELLLWEINDKTPWDNSGNALYPDMGYILNQAKITRIKDQSGDEHWILITGNGVHSSSGKAVIYITNLDDGSLRQKIIIDNTTANLDNGTTSVAAIDLNADTYVDRIYATSLKGKVWRFDYDPEQGVDGKFITRFGTEAAPEPLFIAHDKDQSPQPITGGLVVSPSPLPATAYPGVMVSFGTGKFFEDSDLINSKTQSFYTFWDKDYAEDADYVGELSRDDKLVEQIISNSSDNARRTISNENVDYANGKMGWYIDLPDEGERMINKPVTFFNRLIFNTLVSRSQNQTNECLTLDKNSWLMQVDRLKGGAFITRSYFGGYGKGVVGLNSVFSTQSPNFVQQSDGTISYPSPDKDGNVDDSTKINFDYFRSSRRQLQ